jgi:hypothetical protein
MVPHPVAQVVVRTGFVASFGRQVQIHIGRVYHFVTPSKSGIGVEDLAGFCLVEDTET